MNHGTESDSNTNNLYPIPYLRYDSTGNSYRMAFMNQGLIMLQGSNNYNADNLYPQRNANWCSLDVSYTNDYWG